MVDLVFVVDGSRGVGKENFKHLRSVMATVAGAFEIGADKTRVGVVQYGAEAGPQIPLKQHLSRGELLRAIGSLPFKGGEAMTGNSAPRAREGYCGQDTQGLTLCCLDPTWTNQALKSKGQVLLKNQ